MARKVSVGLEADVAGFIGPVDAAAHATEKLDDHVSELDRSLNKIPADALKAGAAMRLLSGDVKDVSTNFAAVGDKSSAMTILDSRIRSTRGEVKKLTEEFIRTGDVDIFHKLGRASGDLSALTDIRKKLSNSIETGLKDGVSKGGPEAARTFSSLFQGGIINALKSPPVLAAAIGLAALLAIPIGAIIGGAVLAAAGAGAAGLAGFAAVQADKQGRIAAAGTDLLSKVNNQITTGGQSAIAPLLAGIHQLSVALDDIHLERIIQTAAKYIEPLAAGAARFATYLSQGVEHLLAGGGPAVKVLAEELPALGRAVKSAFDAIASGGEGGARALQDTLRAVESFIITTGRIIGFLERAYGALRKFGDGFESVITKIRDFSTVTSVALAPVDAMLHIFDTGRSSAAMYGHSLNNAAHDTEVLGKQADKTAEQVKSIETAFSNLGQSVAGSLTSKIIDQMMGLDQATLHWQSSLNGLSDAVKQNGRALSGNSEKVIHNKEALLGAVQANADLYAQNLLAGDSAQVAGQKYEQNAAQLRKQAIAAGFNAKEVDGLIGKYGKVPSRVQTILATIGLTDALNHLAQILIDFRNLNGKDFKTKYTIITIHDTQFTSSGQRLSGSSHGDGFALGGIRHAATGMIVGPSNPGTLIGEPQTGGEALIPLQGITRHAAMGLMRTAGAGYGLDVVPRGGGGTMRFEHTFSFAGGEDSAMGTAITKLARTGQMQITSRAIVD